MRQPRAVYHLALHDLYAGAGATFAVVGSWSLPLHFGDGRREHNALRGSAALLDRSHRSRFIVSGTDAMEVLDHVFSGPVREIEEGRARRSLALDREGRISDLALIARTGGMTYLVTGEPSRRDVTGESLRAAIAPGYDARLDDRTESTCLLGIAGPAAAAKVSEFLSEGLPGRLPPLHCVAFEAHGFRALATRTSDTGEDGFELMLAPAVAQHLVETLAAAGIPIAGHEAQEVARVEACIPAYDLDLATGLSPAQADLDVLLSIPGGPEGVILSAVILERTELPAAGEPVAARGEVVGELRSCVRGWSLDATIGLAVIKEQAALPGTTLEIAGSPATVVTKPFFRRRST